MPKTPRAMYPRLHTLARQGLLRPEVATDTLTQRDAGLGSAVAGYPYRWLVRVHASVDSGSHPLATHFYTDVAERYSRTVWEYLPQRSRELPRSGGIVSALYLVLLPTDATPAERRKFFFDLESEGRDLVSATNADLDNRIKNAER